MVMLSQPHFASYEKHVRPFSKNYVQVKVTNEQIKKATKWALEMEEAKLKESAWKKDNASAIKRLATGVLAEMVIENYLGIEFIDWSIGVSQDYEKPDMLSAGVNIGIKCVEFNEQHDTSGLDKFPIIFKRNTYPQIFNFYKPEHRLMYICGIAMPEVLNQYQADDLILAPALRAKNVKTAFYGFEFLEPPENIKQYLTDERFTVTK